MRKYTVFVKSCCNLTKSLFVLFDAAAESMNCSLFLKNLKKRFCNNDSQKKLRQAYRKFTVTFIGKFSGNNLSITDIALRN